MSKKIGCSECLHRFNCPDANSTVADMCGAYNHNVRPEKDDPVNHPGHYTSGKIEVIDYIEDQRLPYHLGNAVKYISRAGKKDPSKEVEDLRKAVWYIERFIKLKGGE